MRVGPGPQCYLRMLAVVNLLVRMVDAMLEAKKQLAKAKTDRDKTYYESKCVSLDRQIDRLVYDLYALSEEEIQVVEGLK
jgi:hypothetical protein